MPRYKVTLQYLGTRYSGWQIQTARKTVQGVLSQTLTELAGKPIKVVGASRTDAGVHAQGQVAHFDFPQKDSIVDLRRTLNALLPWDIRIQKIVTASPSFHAQKGARKKRYEFRIYNDLVLPPFLYKRVCHIKHPLRAGEMQAAAQILAGTHDFNAFAASGTSARNRVRTLFLSEVKRRGYNVTYRTEGDGFLQHMVRNIVGTLIEVGLGRREVAEVRSILESGDRRKAGPTASPEGLTLLRIWY